MTREEPSLETLWLRNTETMDNVRRINPTNTFTHPLIHMQKNYTNAQVCIYIHTHVTHIYNICMRACIHTCIREYVHMCIRAYVRTCTCVYVHIYIHTHTCMHIYTYIRAYVHMCIRAYVRTCICAYIHTYTHTHMLSICPFPNACVLLAMLLQPMPPPVKGYF
jgi:hypothetical protein